MRKFEVKITYEVEIESVGKNLTMLHIMDAVYRSQVGDEEGVTEVKPEARYVVFESNMSFEEME